MLPPGSDGGGNPPQGSSSSSSSSGGGTYDAGSVSPGPDAGDPSGADAGGTDAGSIADASVFSHKRGVAYGHNSDADLGALSAGITWWYNWSPQPENGLANGSHGVEFVPMIWGGGFDPNKVASQIPQGAKYLLTINEPNSGTQSNLTPQAAAALWPKIEMVAHARNLQIVSPALNYCGGNCNATDPFSWLDAFFAACKNCQVDYIAAHWYACTKQALTMYLSQYETKYKKPIWLTEFSCLDGSMPPTPAVEAAYMQDAVTTLEADPMIFRYSWFSGRFPQQTAIDLLAGGSGALTPLGQKYVALPGAR
jgi:hypothetical protein